MRSGFPHSQGGAYSAFQHRSDGVLPSPQDISAAPVPVVQPENGIQNNMVATQYPGELRVAYTPAKLQPGYAQSQQNFQELHHHQGTQASKRSTGLQHPVPTDSKHTSCNSHQQIRREDNAVFHSSAHISAQRSSYFGTSANENSVRLSVYNSGKQSECHRQDFSRHFLKGSNSNQNPGLKKSHCNSSSSASITATGHSVVRSSPLLTALLKGNNSDSKYSTMLQILDHDERHRKAQSVKGSSLKCGWTRTQSLDNSGGTHSALHQQQVRLPSLSSQSSTENVRPVRKTKPPTDEEILDFINKSIAESRTILTLKNRNYEHSNKDSDRAYSLQSDNIMPKVDSAAHLPTTSAPDKKDVERRSLNCAVTEQYTAALGQELEEDSPKGSKANVKLTQRVEETDDGATPASEKHLTEYPQIMREVAVTCTKNEEESPVVLTSMPGMTWDHLTEKQTRLTLNHSIPQEQKTSLWSNIKDLDAKDEMPDDKKCHKTQWENGALKLVEAVGLDSVQRITDVSDDLQTKSTSVEPKNKTFLSTSLSKNLMANTKKKKSIDDQQHCGVTSMKAIVHSKLKSPLHKIQIHNVASVPINHSEWLSKQTSCNDVGKDAGCVDLQTDLSMSLSEPKKHAPPYEKEGEKAFSMNTVKNSLFEDLSDNDMPQLATKLPNLEHYEGSLLEARSEIPIYEDISEDESRQTECISGETSSPTQAPEPNVKHSPFENEAYGLVQGQAPMRTEIVPDEELTPKTAACIKAHYAKTDPGFEGQLFPKHDGEKQENHSVSCRPYPILIDADETDDEMDVDWLFIPLVVSDLKFEANDEDQDSPQENVLDVGETGEQGRQCDRSPTHWPSPNPEASAFSPIEVFDTLETLQQMTAVEIKTLVKLGLGSSTLEYEMDSEGEPLTPQNRRESVDSCETEDSLDYSPELERNFMTVSKKLLESSASLPSETDVVVTAKEGESSEVTNMQKVRTRCLNKSGSLQRLREPIKIKAASEHVQPKTNGKKISKKDEISISSSDLEDECNQNCKKRAKRKTFFSSSSDDSEDAENSWCETVEKSFQNNSLPSRDLPAQQHQSTCHDSLFAGLSLSAEECGQMIGTKAASEHVQHNRQSVSKEEIITIHDTDSEDYNYQNYKKPSGKRFFSSGSDSDNDSCVEQMRESCGTVVSQCETAEEKIQETIADSSLSQHPSKLYDTQFEEVKRNARSDVSHRIKKSGELIETKGESEHVQNMTNRRRTLKRRETFCDSEKVESKKKAYTQELLLSESEDSGDDLTSAKNRPSTENAGHLCRTGNTQPHKNRLSSEDSPEKQHQSADKEAISTLDPNHLIPRLLVVEPSQPAERVHKQGKRGTLPPKTSTTSSKKLDTCEKNKPHLYRNTQPKPRPENDKHHAKENNIQASEPKSRTVSRQFSLPSQDGPSTSPRSLPSTSGQLSEARKRSAHSRNMSLPGEATSSCSAPPSKQGSSIPTQHLSPKLHRSHSTPSTLNPCTNTHTNPSSSLRERLKKEWKEHYPPLPSRTRRNGKTSLGMNKNFRTFSDSFRETRPGSNHCDRVPKQRRSSHKTTPLLMKRSRTEAIQRTNDIHRDPTTKPMGSVGKNYKWKNGDKANERIELDWEDN